MSVGDGLVCGLDAEDDARCWGEYSERIHRPGPFSAIAVAGQTACALSPDGTTVCWSSGGEDRPAPSGGSLAQLSMGAYFLCGLDRDGNAGCRSLSTTAAPLADPPAGPFTALDAGGTHVCGLRDDGQIECWNVEREDAEDPGLLEPPAEGFDLVSVGAERACALREGDVWCWGARPLIRSGDFVAVEAGPRFVCAVDAGGEETCWDGAPVVRSQSRNY